MSGWGTGDVVGLVLTVIAVIGIAAWFLDKYGFLRLPDGCMLHALGFLAWGSIMGSAFWLTIGHLGSLVTKGLVLGPFAIAAVAWFHRHR